ncbi:hypothetical protein GCM10027259_02150 [Micromonospora palomenae]
MVHLRSAAPDRQMRFDGLSDLRPAPPRAALVSARPGREFNRGCPGSTGRKSNPLIGECNGNG